MKAKRAVALIICVVAAVTAITSLAACNKNVTKTVSLGTSKISLEDYIPDYKDSYVGSNVFSSRSVSVKKMFDCSPSDSVTMGGGSLVFIEKNALLWGSTVRTYDIYSMTLDRMILTNVTGTPSTQRIDYSSFNYVLCITKDDYNHDYYTLDGQEILRSVTAGELSYQSNSYYVGDSTTATSVYTFSAMGSDGKKATAHFTAKTKNGSTTYERLEESSLSIVSPDYAVGQMNPYVNLFLVDDEYPVESAIKDYKCETIGSIWTFYKDGKKAGSLDLNGKKLLGIVDHYIYFYGVKPLADTVTEGYNYCGENRTKAYELLYRYDVLTDKTASFNYDVHLTYISPAYNRATKAYDAAIVRGYKKVDGVYYENADSNYQQPIVYFTDSKLAVAKDFSNIRMTSICKLSNNKYFAVGASSSDLYLLDENFNVISLPGSSYVFYPEQGLVKFNVEHYYGFADFDGRIVIEPKYKYVSSYRAPMFFNDYALLRNSVTDKTVGVSASGQEVEIPEDQYTVTLYSEDGYYVEKNVNGLGNGWCAYYDFGGNILQRFDLDAQRILTTTMGGLIKYTNGTTVTYYQVG